MSKQELIAFTKRFRFSADDIKEQRRNVPITLKQAKNAVKFYISLGRESKYLKPSFIETRVKILEICLKEKTPLERWTRIRNFLVDRLASQVLPHITARIVQDNEVEPTMVLRDLLNPASLLSQCIKAVVLFNVTDDNVVLPKDVVIDFGSGIEYVFPGHRLLRRGAKLKIHTKQGEIIERVIPDNEEIFALMHGKDLTNKFSTTHSILIDQDSKPHTIKHDGFFDEFNKQYPDFVRAYHLNSDMTPVDILERSLEKNSQRKFLNKFIGNSITKWKWEEGVFTNLDISKIAKEYFPDLQEETKSISWGEYPPSWKPSNYLFDEASLRYELTDLYLQRFSSQERENLLRQQIRDLSIFNLKTFRELIAKWEFDREDGKVVWMLERLNSNYYKHRKDPKGRDKWLKYVTISILIQRYKKPMIAYRMYRRMSPHNDTVDNIKVAYGRLRKEAKEEGYEIENPSHLEEIKTKWNLHETWILFIDLVFIPIKNSCPNLAQMVSQ